MPNLLLTNKCNRNCAYCFAKGKIGDGVDRKDLSFKDLVYVADFLDEGGVKQLGLLGGEPSIHPNFLYFVQYLLAREFDIRVFTNGIFPESLTLELKDTIANSSLGNVELVVNVNEEKYRTKNEDALQRYLFENLPKSIMLGFNIYERNYNPDFLVELCKEYALQKVIRLGMASPIEDHGNSYVSSEHYREIYGRIVDLSDKCAGLDISLNFDCGFMLCQFTDEEIGRLYNNLVDFEFSCGNPLDIGPDLNTWKCFPLSAYHNRSLREFESYRAMDDYYIEAFGDVAGKGYFDKCSECSLKKKNRCAGGCISHYVSRDESYAAK